MTRSNRAAGTPDIPFPKPPERAAFLFQAQKRALVDSLSPENRITLLLQCKDIVRAMPRKISAIETHSFTVTLSAQAVTMIDRLIPIGLHGNSRAEVARTLILSRLEQILASAILSPTATRPVGP
jgi:hypothetical protein